MKFEDFIYEVVKNVFYELQHTHHYTVPEEIKEQVLEKMKARVNEFIK